jgi:hypothetical protein
MSIPGYLFSARAAVLEVRCDRECQQIRWFKPKPLSLRRNFCFLKVIIEIAVLIEEPHCPRSWGPLPCPATGTRLTAPCGLGCSNLNPDPAAIDRMDTASRDQGECLCLRCLRFKSLAIRDLIDLENLRNQIPMQCGAFHIYFPLILMANCCPFFPFRVASQ